MRDLRHLTLPQRVGQLFLIGIQGTRLTADVLVRLDRVRPSGLVTTQRNIETFDQICELNTEFSRACEIPPFLAIEHEGGPVDRLKGVVAPVPSVAELADLGAEFVRTGARVLAAELVAAGFNTTLGPVLDLGLPEFVWRERTLARAAHEVARLGRIELQEFRRRNVISVAGHFPGLGGARRDPHFFLPRVGRTRREVLTEDVVPFNELLGDMDIVRISHGHYPGLGDLRALPASLSPRIVTSLLRETIGFKGVVMTDDLTMGAITSRGLKPETFLEALRAGNDLLMFSQLTPLVEDAHRLITETAVSDSDLREQIDGSVERILRLKERIKFYPHTGRTRTKAHLVRQIERLRNSIPRVERIQVR